MMDKGSVRRNGDNNEQKSKAGEWLLGGTYIKTQC